MSETLVISGGTATIFTSINVLSATALGTTDVSLMVKNTSLDNILDFHFRQTGGTEIAPVAIPSGYSQIVRVQIDSNYNFDYYVSTGQVDIWVVDYSSGVSSLPGSYYGNISEVYMEAGISATQVPNATVLKNMRDADAWIVEHFDRDFFSAQAVTEILDTYDDFEQTIQGAATSSIFLRYRPVQSVTLLEEIDDLGNVVAIYDSTRYYLYTEMGQIVLKPSNISDSGVNTFLNQRKRVQVQYTYGYASVPLKIRQLSNILAAVYTLTQHHGLNWERPSNVGIPSINTSVGSIPNNIRSTIEILGARFDSLIKEIGRYKDDFCVI